MRFIRAAVPPRTRRAGFTLIEIILSLAIIATVFVAMIGLLPAGLTASRDAVNATLTGTVIEDVQNRLRGEPLTPGTASFSPAFYDEHGHRVDLSNAATSAPFFRVEVMIANWNSPPDHTTGLRPISIHVAWPVNAGGEPAGKANQLQLSTVASPLTGPNWSVIDSSYVPKIEL